MHKKSSLSHKVLPKKERLTVVPTIKLLPRLKFNNKVVPDLGESTSSNSKSTSFILPPPKSSKKTNSVILKSRDPVNGQSDSLSFEQYKKSEIIEARRLPQSKFPYWFIDSFYDMDLTRTLRPQTIVFSQYDRSGSLKGFREWENVRIIQEIEVKIRKY